MRRSVLAIGCFLLLAVAGCKDSKPTPGSFTNRKQEIETGAQPETTTRAASAPAGTANPTAIATTNFHPVPMDGFYQRQFVDYRPTESWAQVPRGETNFDGVPFLMFGKIDLTGLGRARDGEFQPSRVGEIPVGRRAARLHLIHGASYDAPDDTPIASLRLRYQNNEVRSLFIRYGVHSRNWYIEARETNPELSDTRSLVIWNGHTRPDGMGTPTRLFKTTFDNPLPAQEILSIDLLSLFARANAVVLAVTLEEVVGAPASPESGWDEDDANYRQEIVVRVLDADTGRPIPNALLKLSVTERDRTYRFGEYSAEVNSRICFSYPPGRFASLLLHLSAPNYSAERVTVDSDNGLFAPEQTVRLFPYQER